MGEELTGCLMLHPVLIKQVSVTLAVNLAVSGGFAHDLMYWRRSLQLKGERHRAQGSTYRASGSSCTCFCPGAFGPCGSGKSIPKI